MSRGRSGDGEATGRAPDAASRTYRMRRQAMAPGAGFWVEDQDGGRAFHVDGQAPQDRRIVSLNDAAGHELYRIQEHEVRIRDTLDVEDAAGRVATVRKTLEAPLRDRYAVDLAGGGCWAAEGNIVNREFDVTGPDGPVAQVSKRWFPAIDGYGIHVEPDADAGLVMMVAIAIDEMAHPER